MKVPYPLRITIQLLATLFAAGSILLYLFVVLAGIKSDGNVLNKWYFLRADTSDLPGATYPITQWSLYGICGYESGDSISKPGDFIGCSSHKPAYPLDPKRNFNDGDSSETWDQFRTNKFYFETRFQFAFYLIALFFAVCQFFLSFGSFFCYPVAIASAASAITSFVFGAIAASLSTAAYVDGRNIFHKHGAEAKLDPSLYDEL